jgi:Zn-dependent protease
MTLSAPALILLSINLGLIWLLMAAPIGMRTIRLRRALAEAPDRVWEAVHPLGRDALWYEAVIEVEAEPETGRVVQRLAHSDRRGEPIRRTLELSDLDGPWQHAYEARVVEDSTLDSSFWQSFRERRMVAASGSGAELVIEQTDRYRGLAFLVFRFFALRREADALAGWLASGKVERRRLFEQPGTQLLMAVVSTFALWPFFGLSANGLIYSSILTVVIALHELGHLAAYRAFGHGTVRMIFIPLLGGVAIGGRPYNSRFEVAVCALMGPGMSAFLVPVLVAAHAALAGAGYGHPLAGYALVALLVLAAFNLLNLLPMSRFDGGQVLKQVFPTQDGLLGGTFLVTAAILFTGWRVGVPSQALYGGLAVMALLSLSNRSGVKMREALVEMPGGERLLAGFGYYAAIAIHAYGLVFACDILFSR